MKKPRIIPSGGYALTIEVCREVSRECIDNVHKIYYFLKNLSELRGKIEVVAGLSAITIYYDPRKTSYKELIRIINDSMDEISSTKTFHTPRKWVIPVLYGGKYGPDLEDVAKLSGLEVEDVVKIHSSREYLCYTIGFTPGFIYLGEVDERIAVPRLKTPRTRVPRGSVGIAGSLTGVYSIESPGGWRLIGRTPLSLFDPTRDEPMIIKPGDLVVFKPITEDEYRELYNVFIGDYNG